MIWDSYPSWDSYPRMSGFGTAGAAPDPQELKTVAEAIRLYGFVCDPPFESMPVGQTHRGLQIRFICNDQSLMYRITLSPDGKQVTIRPWSE